jgi:hypothetical protein
MTEHPLAAPMPQLILEMIANIRCGECGSIRELFVLKDRANSLGVAEPRGKPRFVFFEDEHPDLRTNLDTLVRAGCLVCVSAEEPPIYCMAEPFAQQLLMGRNPLPQWFLDKWLSQHAAAVGQQQSA